MGIGAARCACAASHAASLGAPPAAPAVAPRSVASACSVPVCVPSHSVWPYFLFQFLDASTTLLLVWKSSAALHLPPRVPPYQVLLLCESSPPCPLRPYVFHTSSRIVSCCWVLLVVSWAAASIRLFFYHAGWHICLYLTYSTVRFRVRDPLKRSIDLGAAAWDGRAAAIDRRRDLLAPPFSS